MHSIGSTAAVRELQRNGSMAMTVLRSGAQLVGVQHRSATVRPFTSGAPRCIRHPRGVAAPRSAATETHLVHSAFLLLRLLSACLQSFSLAVSCIMHAPSTTVNLRKERCGILVRLLRWFLALVKRSIG